MTSKFNVAIILATYNGSKYLKEQIDSIFGQKDCDIHLFVFDDCSDDDSLEIVKRYSSQRVTLFSNSINSGSAAINFLNSLLYLKKSIDCSLYDFFALADQDDIWDKNKIYNACKILSGGFNLYYSNLTIFDNNLASRRILKKSNYPLKKFDYLFQGGSAGCTYVFDENLLDRINANFIKIRNDIWRYFSHDWFIYFVCRNENLKVFQDKRSFIYYRIHGENLHGGLNKSNLKSYFLRFNLVRSEWYVSHSNGFISLVDKDSEAFYIYELFVKNYFSRVFILLKYNFKLFRSNTTFFKVLLATILSLKLKKKQIF